VSFRGGIDKRHKNVNVLAGYTAADHFQAFAQETLSAMDDTERQALLAEADQCRAKVAGFAPLTDFAAETRTMDPAKLTALTSDPRFAMMFPQPNYRFSWIDPTKIVAVQCFVNDQTEPIPSDEDGLIEWALPSDWRVPVEISFIPPLGPIYVVTSSPHFNGLRIDTEAATGDIFIRPPVHANLVQVVEFGGRYYLRNGYHRVAGAVAQGVDEIPAMVFSATQLPEVDIPTLGNAGFASWYLSGLSRPPLVADFRGDASVQIKMREKRYGATVTLQISPLNIGI
jgi:hypothetical protein